MKTFMIALMLLLPVYGYCQQDPIGSTSKETGLLLKDDVTRMIIHNSSGDRAYDYVKQISMWERSGFEQRYNDAANWVKTKALEFGLSEVEIENYPADDTTEYFGSPVGEPWIAKKGELWVVKPYLFKITSFEDLPMSLAPNSASADTTAELVDVGNGLERDYEGKNVKGKIVLTTRDPGSVASIAVAKKGAIGVVSSYTVPYWDYSNRLPGDFPNQVGWSVLYGTGGKPAFAFMISDLKLKELRSILNRGEKVSMQVSVETEYRPGNIKIVSGLIKGSQFPDEEIVITAHLDHYKPGANDNASGCAAALEIARTLNYLISTKQIPPPLRTIRFLWLPELSGTTVWFSKHANDPKKRIVNLNFDMLGANVVETNSQFVVNYTPGWNGHYINALSESVMDFLNTYNNTRYARRKDYAINSVNGTRNPARAVMQKYSRGSDHQIFNDFGIAGVAFTTWPDDNYHSSQDSPNHVDPTQLHRATFVGLTLLLTNAYSTDEHADALLGQVIAYGQKRIADDELKGLNLLYGSAAENLKTNAYLAKVIVQNGFDREKKSLQSCAALARNSAGQIEKYQQILNQREKAVIQNLNEIISIRTKNLKLAPIKELFVEADESKFAKLVPMRNKGKELFGYYSARSVAIKDTELNLPLFEAEVQKKLNELREQEIAELKIYDFYNALASYADGNRSIVDIRNAIFSEYGALFSLASLEKLFRAFERAHAMVIKSKK